MIADLLGSKLLAAQVEGPSDQAEQLGRRVAQQLLKNGGREILTQIRHGIPGQ